jgi:hypothetical protein
MGRRARPRTLSEIRELAQKSAPEAIEALLEVLRGSGGKHLCKVRASDRVKAATELLTWAYASQEAAQADAKQSLDDVPRPQRIAVLRKAADEEERLLNAETKELH